MKENGIGDGVAEGETHTQLKNIPRIDDGERAINWEIWASEFSEAPGRKPKPKAQKKWSLKAYTANKQLGFGF